MTYADFLKIVILINNRLTIKVVLCEHYNVRYRSLLRLYSASTTDVRYRSLLRLYSASTTMFAIAHY